MIPPRYESPIQIEDIQEGMKMEVHMLSGKHAGKEFYFGPVARRYTDHISESCGLILYIRDLAHAEIRVRNV